jgi:hypothetical protein
VVIICAGVIGRQPLPGQVWFWLQYLLGFRRLGHDVYFLEESGDYAYSYDFETMTESEDPDDAAATLERLLTPFGFAGRWAYRVGDRCVGMPRDDFVAICESADVLLMMPTGIWLWRPEYDAPRVRLFLDGDPGFTQLRAIRGEWPINETIERCNRFFTYGPGLLHSPLPDLGIAWRLTRPPVVLERWPRADPATDGAFTTVMHWSLDPSPEFEGDSYGQKDVEFERLLELPRHTAQPLEVALNDGPFGRLAEHGWRAVSTPPTTLDGYQAYIRASRGEFSVAKNGYVKARTGWMSERTTCFLATGRPAVVQETGLSDWVPTGEGLLTFDGVRDAAAAIDSVNAEYERHCDAARRLAEEEFDSDRVLAALLDDADA